MAYAYAKRCFFFVGILFSFLCIWGCGVKNPIFVSEDFPRKNLIAEIKQFEKKIGYTKDINFHFYDPGKKFYYLCYYTGKFSLPASYGDSELKFKYGIERGCDIDTAQYDVMLKTVEAVARIGGTPVTASLVSESFLRFVMVVFHEDYHEEVLLSSSDIDEAAATLMGIVATQEFIQEKYGAHSTIAQSISQEPEFFLKKSEIMNTYYDQLKKLYSSLQQGQITEDEALQAKNVLFAKLGQECESIVPKSGMGTKVCPWVLNNAGLSHEMTYTRHFPRMYDMWVASGKNAKALFDSFKKNLK